MEVRASNKREWMWNRVNLSGVKDLSSDLLTLFLQHFCLIDACKLAQDIDFIE